MNDNPCGIWLAEFARDYGRRPLPHEIWQAAYLASAKQTRERCVEIAASMVSPIDITNALRNLPLEEEP